MHIETTNPNLEIQKQFIDDEIVTFIKRPRSAREEVYPISSFSYGIKSTEVKPNNVKYTTN
jgi:hypothetical protein